jgi:hypothetical protein
VDKVKDARLTTERSLGGHGDSESSPLVITDRTVTRRLLVDWGLVARVKDSWLADELSLDGPELPLLLLAVLTLYRCLSVPIINKRKAGGNDQSVCVCAKTNDRLQEY